MKISVLMPAYNIANLITRGLESIARQTRMPAEVVVSDDGSTDDTVAVARAFGKARPQIALTIVSGPNGGVAVARNRALRAASGDHIALLDADDEMLPEQLERLSRGYELFPGAAVTFGDVIQKFGDTGKEIPSLVASRLQGATSEAGGGWQQFIHVFAMTLRGNRVPNQCTLIRREALDACGAWDDNFRAVEDRDLFLRLASQGKFYFYPQDLAVKHERSESVSANSYVMSKYQFRVIKKAATHSAAAAEILAEAAVEYAFAASVAGPKELRQARREIREAGVRLPFTESAKGWIRAVIS